MKSNELVHDNEKWSSIASRTKERLFPTLKEPHIELKDELSQIFGDSPSSSTSLSNSSLLSTLSAKNKETTYQYTSNKSQLTIDANDLTPDVVARHIDCLTKNYYLCHWKDYLHAVAKGMLKFVASFISI